LAKQLRLGILGGSFDPFHRGHLRLGLSVLDAGLVDQLLVIPTGDPPHKDCFAGAEDRWKMVVAACSADDRLIPSRTELDRPGSTFAYDTLRSLRLQYPGASFCYLIGADVVMTLHLWHRYKEVLSLCTFLVFSRPGTDEASLSGALCRLSREGGRFTRIQADPMDISSSGIRSALAAGNLPESLDPPVLEYCRCKGLYGAGGRLEHIDEWLDSLFAALKPRRFAHSLSVAYTARRLAEIHGLDPLKAEQAGLLHDCAKCLPFDEMRSIALQNGLTDDSAFLSSGALLHSLVGAHLARIQYGMNDPEVLEAIRFHNTGAPGMSRLSMCVCLADSIEPLRRSYPHLEKVRALARDSLEKALLLSLEGTADYVKSRNQYLHPRTRETTRWLRRQAVPSLSESI
jgi:nicotinate (nicotinamide) nucleotide adenylyltransferase/putative HD superfamily hydrolase of NAD metabolism